MEDLKMELGKEKNAMIFGARKDDWLKIKEEMKKYDCELLCYVVSSKEGNPSDICNIPVEQVRDICAEDKKNPIIISNAMEKEAEIASFLKKNGFQKIYFGVRRYGSLSEDEKAYFEHCGWNIQFNPSVPETPSEDSVNLKIYVVTSHLNQHAASKKITSDIMCYIQAGSALTTQTICEIQDNTGDNISEKNRFYCELTAGYWIYKNDHIHDYVGLYHYSRTFALEEKELYHYFNSGVDVILNEPLLYFSSRKHFWDSDRKLEESIKTACPEYSETYARYREEGLFVPSNMIVARKEIFDRYYEWLFAVLETYEKISQDRNEKVEPRTMGYLGEDLTGVYFLHHSRDWKIVYTTQKELF